MPGLLKIGLTERSNPLVRMRELFTTGVPTPFVCEAAWIVSDAKSVESALHSKFVGSRVSPTREFFKLETHTAVSALASLGNTDLTEEVREQFNAASEIAFRRPTQDFFHMGYAVGDKFYAGTTGEFVTVFDNRRVEYEGAIMSLTAARTIICKKHPDLPATGSFHFNGEAVLSRYEKTYKS